MIDAGSRGDVFTPGLTCALLTALGALSFRWVPLSAEQTTAAETRLVASQQAPSVAVSRSRDEVTVDDRSLRVRVGDVWRTWWRADAAPSRWAAANDALADAVRWRASSPGVEWSELQLAGSSAASRARIVLVRLDPGFVRLALHAVVTEGKSTGPWSIEEAPASALVALNAGQFDDDGPWGWVVHRGHEVRAPGTGPLASAVVVDSAGAVRIVDAQELTAARARGDASEALQSYPAVLIGDGVVPEPLRAGGRGVDLEHRDTRVALGMLRDGRVLLVLTRFDALGAAAGVIPLGPTIPEMSALMGALGCARAVLLDGGLSGQLLLRGASGEVQRWRGLRRVPLGLVGYRK